MPQREMIDADAIRRALIGVTPGEWNESETSGHVVAPSGIVGSIRRIEDRAFVRRAPEYVEWLLAENDRLVRALDEATATDEADEATL